MKKGVILGVLFITILLSTSFISAAWWDFFLKPGPGLSPEDELEGIPQCSDGIDNDGDGKIDALTEGVDKNNCEEIRYSNGETNCDRYGDSYYFGRTKNQENSEIDNFVNSFEEYTNIPSSGNTWCNQITVNQVCKLAGYNTAQIINLRAEGEFTREGFTACSRDKCNQDSSCIGWHSKRDNHFAYWDESKNDFVNENANGATVGRLNRGIKKLLCTNPISECNDGIDNDGDGLIDLDDSGCENAKDNSEVPHDPQCDNLEDNSEADECTDSDGGKNYDVKGNVTQSSGEVDYDHCHEGETDYSGKDLSEYFCEDGIAKVERYECLNGCKDGVCRLAPTCKDGSNEMKIINVKDKKIVNTLTVLVREIEGPYTETPGKYSHKVTIESGNNRVWGNKMILSEENPKSVITITNQMYTIELMFATESTAAIKVTCGEIVSESCKDGDGGENYYKKSTCEDSFGAVGVDECIDGKLSEKICTDGLAHNNCFSTILLDCPNGCADGACIPGREPYCSAIGSKSEGWYQTVFDDSYLWPSDIIMNGDNPAFDQCNGCVAECRIPDGDSNTGDSMPIGWYSSCNGGLIKVDVGCSPECESDADCPEWTWDSYCLKAEDEKDKTISTGKSFQCSSSGNCIPKDINVNSKECPYGCEANSCNPKPLCIVGSSESKTFVQRTSTEINGLNILALNSGSTDSELVVRLNAGDRENLILTQSDPKTQVNFRDKTFQVELVSVMGAPPEIKVTCGAVESSDNKIEHIWYHEEEGKLSVGYSYKGEKGDVNINLIREKDDGSYEGSECDTSEISCEVSTSTRVDKDGIVQHRYEENTCHLKTSCTHPDTNSDVRSFVKVADSASPWINAVKAIERREDGCKILDGEVSNEIARLRKESYIPSEGREAYPGIHIVTGADGGQIWRVNEVSGTQATFKDTMDLESSPVVVLFNSNGVGKLPLRGGSEAEVQVFNRNEYYSIKVNEKPYSSAFTWNCYPKKSIEFHEGWNLLNMLVAFDLLNLEHPDKGVWNENKVAAVYHYDQENKEYVNPVKDRNKWEKIMNNLEENENDLELATFLQSSVWVYFKEDRTVEYEMRNLDELGPLNNVVLGPGWNFFSETPEIDGKTPNKLKGPCDLLDVARFDSKIQDWYLFTEDDRENMELGKDKLLGGLLVKVSEKCQPNIDITPPTPDFPPEDLIPAPPAIPTTA